MSNNAGNFLAANKELKDLWAKIDHERVQTTFTNHKITLCFIPPLAPHFVGVHEAMMKSATRAFQAILRNAHIQ